MDALHRSMAHTPFDAIRDVVENAFVRDFPDEVIRAVRAVRKLSVCPACDTAKQHIQTPHHQGPDHPALEPLDRLHIDLAGPFPPAADMEAVKKKDRAATKKVVWDVQGKEHVLIVVDEASGYVICRGLQDKSMARDALRTIFAQLKTIFGRGIRRIRVDNGGEFQFLDRDDSCQGVEIERSSPGVPRQNGRAECMVGILKDAARTMVQAARLPAFLMVIAMEHAAVVRNMTFKVRYKDKDTTAYLIFHQGQAPHVAKLHPFGSLAFVTVPKPRDTFSARSAVGIYAGFDGLRHWVLTTRDRDWIRLSTRDVKVVKDALALDHLCKWVDPDALKSFRYRYVNRREQEWAEASPRTVCDSSGLRTPAFFWGRVLPTSSEHSTPPVQV